MPTDPSFLLGLLAVATQCVTLEQWEEALAARRAVKDLDVGEWLVERGWLTPRAHRALAVVVEERSWKFPEGTIPAPAAMPVLGVVAGPVPPPAPPTPAGPRPAPSTPDSSPSPAPQADT